MIEYLNNLDSSVFLFFNGIRAHWLDMFMLLSSDRFVWVPFYAVLLFVIFRGAGWRAAILFTIGCALAITFTDQLCASIIRPAAVRMRPSNLMNPLSEFAHIVDDYRGGDYGFPSCHAANSFALATFMALFCRRRWFVITMFGWAFFNSYTRLYLGVHYPGDLLVGALVGSVLAAGCYLACLVLSHRIEPLRISVHEIKSRLTTPILRFFPATSRGWSLAISPLSFVWIILALTLLYIILLSI